MIISLNKFLKKIILTGTTGNLGEHILKASKLSFLPINRDNWETLDSLKLGECDTVIHSAYDLKKSIKNFVFISSCSVYGETSNSSEDKICQPITMNGHIKAFNEEPI